MLSIYGRLFSAGYVSGASWELSVESFPVANNCFTFRKLCPRRISVHVKDKSISKIS